MSIRSITSAIAPDPEVAALAADAAAEKNVKPCSFRGCPLPSTHSFKGKDGGSFCDEHTRERFLHRWDPSNGWKGLKNFLYECFPEKFDADGGCPPHVVVAIKTIFDGLTNKRSIFSNLAAFFMFRGIGKSTLVIGGVAYAAAFNLIEHVAYRGRSMNKAKVDFMDRIKAMFFDETFVFVFGNLVPGPKEPGTRWTETDIVLKNGMKIRCFGIEQSSHGSLAGNRRVQFWIWDDVEDFENVKTVESREAIFVKLFGEDIPAADPIKSFGIYLGTPKHIDGLYSKIRNHGVFKKVEFWLFKKNVDGSFLLDAEGRRIPQWPERFSYEKCLQIESTVGLGRSGKRLFNSEYLGILEFDEDKAIPESMLRTIECKIEWRHGRNWCLIESIDGAPVRNQEWIACTVGISIDLATSFKATAHHTAGTVLVTLSGGWQIVYHMFFGKFRDHDVMPRTTGIGYYEVAMNRSDIIMPGIVGECFRLPWEYKADYLVIDATGQQEQTARRVSDIKDNWYDRNKAFEGHRFTLHKSYRSRQSESKRDWILHAVQRYTDRGELFLRGKVKERLSDKGEVVGRTLPFPELVSQLVNLNSIESDDIVDSLAQNLDYSKVPKKDMLHEFEFRQKNMVRRKTTEVDDELFMLANMGGN